MTLSHLTTHSERNISLLKTHHWVFTLVIDFRLCFSIVSRSKKVVDRDADISIPLLEDPRPPAPGLPSLVQHQSWRKPRAGRRLITISFIMWIMSVSNLMMGWDKSTSKYFTSTRSQNTLARPSIRQHGAAGVNLQWGACAGPGLCFSHER